MMIVYGIMCVLICIIIWIELMDIFTSFSNRPRAYLFCEERNMFEMVDHLLNHLNKTKILCISFVSKIYIYQNVSIRYSDSIHYHWIKDFRRQFNSVSCITFKSNAIRLILNVTLNLEQCMSRVHICVINLIWIELYGS